MNPDIDLKRFGSSSTVGAAASGRHLVSPPRRILSRYILPASLLIGFAAVGVYAFRETLEKTIPVEVVMPVPYEAGGAGPAGVTAGVAAAVAEKADAPADSAASLGPVLFQAPGWIEPEPYPILISSLRAGTVKDIRVIEGQDVTSGSVVATLIGDDARLEVEAAESALAMKRVRLKAARENWDNPIELVENVEVARATQEKLRAEERRLKDILSLARLDAEAGKALRLSGFEASLDTLKKETELSASRNHLAETQAQMKLTSATLRAATERLDLRIDDREALEMAEAEVRAAETDLAVARLALERSEIVAPADGVIMRLFASPGMMLSADMEPGMNVASLYQPDRLQVKADVPLVEAAKVRPGLRAVIEVEALPGRKFDGELINIVPQFDLQKNILPVKVRINDPDRSLRPEMIVRVSFHADGGGVKPKTGMQQVDAGNTLPQQVATSNLSYLVPEGAVHVDGDERVVWVVGVDQRAVVKPVMASVADTAGMTLIEKGLVISDKVIVSPVDQLEAGMKVQWKDGEK